MTSLMASDGLPLQVRAVNDCNRDSVEILNKNKKLQKALLVAQNAARDAEARERQRMEDGAGVVEQLMKQLQASEALLAEAQARGGRGFERDHEKDAREDALERERQRAQKKMDEEKKRLEAAAAEEVKKAGGRLNELEHEVGSLRDQLDGATRAAKQAAKETAREKEAHALTAEKLAALEKVRKDEADKLEKLHVREVKVNGAVKQINGALGKIRGFLEETEEHLKTDLCCLSCLNPLLEPQVLVPCGHSVCCACYRGMDAKTTSQDPYKYCPVCKANETGRQVKQGQPVEGFHNPMLDLCLQRLRTKVQRVETFLNLAGSISQSMQLS